MFLLDTNIVSGLRARSGGHIDPHLIAWSEGVDRDGLFISAMTIYELEIGVLGKERRDPRQGAVLREWIDRRVRVTFAERTIAIDAVVAARAAALHVPDPKPERDSFIAATALVHGMTVVTRNVADFQSMGVPILNPWDLDQA